MTQAARESVDEVFVVGAGSRVPGARGATSTPTAPASLAPGATPTADPDRFPHRPPRRPRSAASTSCCSASTPAWGGGRFLTDTMIVASLDRVAGTVSLLSFPRDLVDVPLPGGGRFSGKLNSLLAYARATRERSRVRAATGTTS